ncbi:hypothetical protein Amet_4380 [Alkaliphilus metalliredigens QYMF]|uniref:Uncharacterized protein n=1 Tax=Alkaliphilus metalliredigens (strain QYMF) TaxID=293826 RepID=A6TKB2_ALKMQ|nr:hypothetical protein [Alkaliphilus metalliredigens]ABR46630.1 hypothetical protein Amet_0402 [Alkaliphilus metalliredigens QYMF]ABR48103.1 hypothetical protein Amet_1940 [Alkaliphilus metalliredigens QYMF]ABR50454.1 hypothetical protein Amet_4380 [Alkaliphilus metalliredigens QYMF]
MSVIVVKNNIFNVNKIVNVQRLHITGSNPFYELAVSCIDKKIYRVRYEMHEEELLEVDFEDFRYKLDQLTLFR